MVGGLRNDENECFRPGRLALTPGSRRTLVIHLDIVCESARRSQENESDRTLPEYGIHLFQWYTHSLRVHFYELLDQGELIGERDAYGNKRQ